MLTSSREERDLVESYQLGVNAYVVKPVDFGKFVESIKKLGYFWAVLNEPPPISGQYPNPRGVKTDVTPIRVLYLEDNEADAELVQALLAEAGIACELTRVETQAEFAAALEAGGFTLILSDNSLPTYDGLSALAYARERCPDLPFIFVSGTLGEEAAIEALKAGATDYVLKDGSPGWCRR